MQQAVRSNETFQETGVVLGQSSGALVVATGSGNYEAERAISCLVAPEVGDTVLLTVPPKGPLYVLAVLDRRHEGPLSIESERSIALRTRGELTFAAAHQVETRAARVTTTAHHLEMRAVEGALSFTNLELVTNLLHTNARRVKAVLGVLDAVLERASQHVKRSYRFVDELEMTRAKEMSTQVERTYHLRAQNTLIDAEELVRMQAEQIHLG
jgi:hypothetical protein